MGRFAAFSIIYLYISIQAYNIQFVTRRLLLGCEREGGRELENYFPRIVGRGGERESACQTDPDNVPK